MAKASDRAWADYWRAKQRRESNILWTKMHKTGECDEGQCWACGSWIKYHANGRQAGHSGDCKESA